MLLLAKECRGFMQRLGYAVGNDADQEAIIPQIFGQDDLTARVGGAGCSNLQGNILAYMVA